MHIEQGMTDRRSFFSDRKVIADLDRKNDRKVIAIAKSVDRDLAIARSLF